MELRTQVEIILDKHPYTRNSDVSLMIELWKKFYPAHIKVTSDNTHGIYLKSLYTLPREDNIKRIRAIIQNDLHLFLPTEEKIRRKRRIKEQEWRDYILKHKLDILQVKDYN